MIKNISVLGAGTMGHGIAETFAMNGYPVSLYEPYEPIRVSCKNTIKGELEFLAENGLITKNAVAESLDRITVYDDMVKRKQAQANSGSASRSSCQAAVLSGHMKTTR